MQRINRQEQVDVFSDLNKAPRNAQNLNKFSYFSISMKETFYCDSWTLTFKTFYVS